MDGPPAALQAAGAAGVIPAPDFGWSTQYYRAAEQSLKKARQMPMKTPVAGIGSQVAGGREAGEFLCTQRDIP